MNLRGLLRLYAHISGFALGMAFLASCSSQRKLSYVEKRAPASTPAESAASPLRAKLAAFTSFAKACPAELRELLPQLSQERVKFPPCPQALLADFQAAQAILAAQEKSTVEELINSQCRSLDPDYGGSPLDALIESVVPRPTRGAKSVDTEDASPLSEADLMKRMRLRDTLLEVKALHSPLEQWIRVNGDFVIPEEELTFVDRLATVEKCRMSDQEVDQSYRTIHSLEALARIQPEAEPQRGRILRFLGGVHRVIDRKIQEYFQP